MPKITKLEVRNFRNIDHADYDLSDRVAFSGKNFIGKSNSLQAIHWLLSDYLLDGSQDLSSIKPLDDTKKEVSVKITLDDGTTIGKTYAENWVKTRGTDEVTLQGHTTTYYIDGIKQARISEAIDQIRARLGLDSYFPKAKIDPLRMLINPEYLTQQVDWKVLRNYIIELVGDVSDDDVIRTNPKFEILRQPLAKFMGKTDNLVKHYKSLIKSNKDEIYKQEVLIDELSKVQDVDSKALAEAQAKIKELDERLAELRLNKAQAKNPRLADIDKEIAKLIQEKEQSIEADRKAYEATNLETNKRIAECADKKNQLTDRLNKAKFSRIDLESQKLKLKAQIQSNLATIESNNKRVQELREEWLKESEKEFVGWELPSTSNCPQCGYVLNQDAIKQAQEALEKAKADFEVNKKARLDKIAADGSALKLEAENLTYKNVDWFKEQQTAEQKLADLDKEINNLQSEIRRLDDEITRLNNSIVPYVNSDRTNEIIGKIAKLREEYNQEVTKNVTAAIDEQIAQVESQKEEHNKTIKEHAYYEYNQIRLKEAKSTLEIHQRELTDNETILMLTEDFIRAKLDLLDKNIASVFGNIKFKLIETNIKEGSYNEVCYPLILGKETPYHNGSTSERIITGVAIIEAIRKHLGLPELPIIFDEAESLDNETLVNRLNTSCQIITARVDDRYIKPTVINI